MFDASQLYFENKYFSLKHSCLFNSINYFDIIRKEPTLPGAYTEILEILAPAILQNDDSCRFLISQDDYYLLNDMQYIGSKIEGYFFLDLINANSQNLSLKLWDGEQSVVYSNLTDSPIYFAKNLSPIRIILKIKNPTINISNISQNYFEFCKYRERLTIGITESEVYDSHQISSFKQILAQPKLERTLNVFSDLIHNRRSAQIFQNRNFSKLEIDNILEDSYFRQNSGFFPVGLAGGFQTTQVYIWSNSFIDFSSGLYLVDCNTREWQPINFSLTKEQIHFLTFSQEKFKEVNTYFFLVAKLNDIQEKYGSRSYRYVNMNIGATIQQIHLSCHSRNISMRAIGGFDDVVLSAKLMLPKYDVLSAVIGIGGVV